MAGADVAVTATYQASIEGYKQKFNLSDTEALDTIKRGVKLAKTARDQAEQKKGIPITVSDCRSSLNDGLMNNKHT